MDLSSPHVNSINDYISKDEFTLHYATFDDALNLVAQHGKDTLMPFASVQFAQRMASFWASIGRTNFTLTFTSSLVYVPVPISLITWLMPLSGC